MEGDDHQLRRIDAATLLPLLRARPPHKNFGATLRLIHDATARVAVHQRGVVESYTRVVLQAAQRGPVDLNHLQMGLVEVVAQWSVDHQRTLLSELSAAWPDAQGARARLLGELQAICEVSALAESGDLQEAVSHVFLLMLTGARPPVWTTAFAEGLAELDARPTGAELQAAQPVVAARAPAAHALVHADLPDVVHVLVALDEGSA